MLLALLSAAVVVIVFAPQWWRAVLIATAAFSIISEVALWRWLLRRPSDLAD